MEFLRRWWAQIRQQLSQMTQPARWLLVSLVVILLFVAGAVLLWVGQPDWAPIGPYSPDREPEVVARLEHANIRVNNAGARLLVPVADRERAFAVLAENDLLAADTSKVFDELAARQNLFTSNENMKQNLLLAKQKYLGQVIRKMRGVRAADVMVSVPEQTGFGAAAVRPSASVNVITESSRPVGKHLVAAIAGLVSGAVAEMRPEDVVIVDANLGRSFTVQDQTQVGADEAMELVRQLEERHREKIQNVLSYIPGVIVAVNVRTDNIRTQDVQKFAYEKTEPLESEMMEERNRQNTSRAAEPGARPNTQLSIDSGGGSGMTESETRQQRSYRDKPIVQRVHQTMVGQTTKQINVTINVPRRYFESLFLAGKPANTQPPDDAALGPIITQQLDQIKAQVQPLISAEETGIVTAHMVPDPSSYRSAQAAGAASGLMAVMDSGYARPALLGLLALVSLALMFALVRKAAAQPELPSARELAGVPPTLPGEDDLVGEAEESELGMSGVELDEEEIRSRKIAEQISEMVKANPGEAANLIRKWVRTED